MVNLVRMIHHPAQFLAEHMQDRKWWKAFTFILLTFLATSLFPQINHAGNLRLFIGDLLILFLLIFGTYPLACLALYWAGRAVQSPISYRAILATWGYSYLPIFLFWTLLVISHAVLPAGIPIFAAGVLGYALLSLMIALFLWKVLFYFIELRVVLGLSPWQMVIASVIIGVLFIGYSIFVGAVFGLKIPIV